MAQSQKSRATGELRHRGWSIDWATLTQPLDYTQIDLPRGVLRRWTTYERTATGVGLEGLTDAGAERHITLDVVYPDVIRFRLCLSPSEAPKSEILVAEALPTASFELGEDTDQLSVVTSRIRVEIRRTPWQIRVYGAKRDHPFFQQQIEDRAYGPAYEVAPVGLYTEAGGREIAHEAIAIGPDEAFYGFGERFSRLNKRGQAFVSWASDCGNVTSQRGYKNVPFFISSAGYGLFIHTGAPIAYDVGGRSNSTLAFDVVGEPTRGANLDYFLIYGPTYRHILKRYTDLTGRAPVPPKWSFGFWISRCMYQRREEVEDVAHEMRARGFPCDVLSLDPGWMGDPPWSTFEWDTVAFPEPDEMMAELRALGIRTCLWITPYVAPGSHAYEEAADGGYFVKHADGGVSPIVEAFAGAEMGAVDFTNPQATAWFQSQLMDLLHSGVAVFKSDFGEQAPADAVYHDGRSGLAMHNLYPLLYNRAVFETTERAFGRGLTWGRSGYAGSQRYPVQWGGDSYASFDQMAGQLRGLLSYGMSGVPFCSHDIGGFDYPPRVFDAVVHACDVDNPPLTILDWAERYGDAIPAAGQDRDVAVYVRWLQFGVFSSHTRAHGKQPREPWEYGPEAERIAHTYLDLRYRLLPYIYSEAVQCSRTGLPMVRPLVLMYQDDVNTRDVDLEYLFGDSFLVAPIVTHSPRRKVYLPEGIWIDYWTKADLEGGCWIEVEAPLDTLPLWVKAGSVIPYGPTMDYVGQRPLDPLTLEFYQPAAVGHLTVYDEDLPGIAVSYAQGGDALRVSVKGAPGAVEATVFGAALAVQLKQEPSS